MVHVADEMQRLGLDLPLLIGGATTSKVHTAVKIAPKYDNPVIYVTDASRVVGVVGKLLNDDVKPAYVAEVDEEYSAIRETRSRTPRKGNYLPIAEARANGFETNWSAQSPTPPTFLGTQSLDDYALENLLDTIDWSPFFQSWDLRGKYPKIFDDEIIGTQARELFDDAQVILKRIIDGKLLQARAVFGFWPANSVGDDVEVYTDESRSEVLTTVHFIRQQLKKSSSRPNDCLADFIAPKDSGVADYIGGFAVTTGFGCDELAAEYEAAHDDYNAIMVKALADRLAEAFAEHLHQRVRREFWGYATDEYFDNEALIKEAYRGIRPAPGYPACPDHREKAELFRILDASSAVGITLTESFAMFPGASVSGYYLAHPDAYYFGVGRIYKDQVDDYAKRTECSISDSERWLAPVLGYSPDS
jgi:5-methyltetrahydrofolate--homocysteine methyltransferase